jgi:hypothetical protein
MKSIRELFRELSIREGQALAAEYPPAEGPQCQSGSRTHDGRVYICTRPEGHAGPHLAHIPGPSAIATWSGLSRTDRS